MSAERVFAGRQVTPAPLWKLCRMLTCTTPLLQQVHFRPPKSPPLLGVFRHLSFSAVAQEGGVNLVDTAEQYPIPSDALRPEGLTEEIIGKWVAKDKTRRDKIVVSTKITGGLNVNAQNIRDDLDASLKRREGTNDGEIIR